jgi:opacity protein-like surface antigen
MIRNIYLTLVLLIAATSLLNAQSIDQEPVGGSLSQPQPFLYSINSLNPAARHWSINYSGGYGQYTVTPLGFDGVDQDFAVKGYLGDRFSLMATMGVGFGSNGNTQTYQQAEVFKDFIGGKNPTGFRFGTSLGVIREFSNDVVALSRFNAAYESFSWKFAANARVEHAFAADRDAFDLITSVGIQRKIVGQLFGGVEAVGQDLEGLWETDESEGGAKVLIGPSLNFVPVGSRFSFSLCAGPILYVTHSTITPDDSAVRELPLNNGFTVKFNVGFNFL